MSDTYIVVYDWVSDCSLPGALHLLQYEEICSTPISLRS